MLLYALPIFLGAFLLFQIQPLIASCILPWFGGSPAVWTTCMLFFQVLLLAGYAYAHALVSRFSPKAQAILQGLLLLLSLAMMALLRTRWDVPIIPDASLKPDASALPIPYILALLTVAVGLPYLALSTTSPLLQAWFHLSRPGVSPYRLYALSNTGSLLALLSYPVLVEPNFTLRTQGSLWSLGYLLFALAYLGCAVGMARTRATASDASLEESPDDGPPPALRRRLLWIALPALASTMLLAVTNQICQEVAVIPFLWVLPLGLYLLSFILCFDSAQWYDRAAYLPALLLTLPLVVVVLHHDTELSARLQIGVYVLTMFVVCMFCHGELVARRPRPRYLTSFYLAVSAGGALGGIFVALVAPLVFSGFYELHVALGLSALVGLVTLFHWQTVPPLVRKPLAMTLAAAAIVWPVVMGLQSHVSNEHALLASRSFYGVFRVNDYHPQDPLAHKHILVHGRTIHGSQLLAPEFRHQPTTYYSTDSGIGLILNRHPRRLAQRGDRSLRVGLVGLGTGTLAAYGRPGDFFNFYEINPRIAAMARDARYFTYLTDSLASWHITLGDARLSLERDLARSGSQQYDVIVLDAFSSDSIPVHLLTREALDLYLKHLRGPDGVIAVHVSNRALDLQPVVWSLADALHLRTALISTPEHKDVYASDWVLVTPSENALRDSMIAKATTPRPVSQPLRLWTDDYHNLFRILR
jgi:hypothetical protein